MSKSDKSKRAQVAKPTLSRPEVRIIGETSLGFSISRGDSEVVESLRNDDISTFFELATQYLMPEKIVKIFKGIWSNLSQQLKDLYSRRYGFDRFPC